jgi:MOSC domain-containing protein YiiM
LPKQGIFCKVIEGGVVTVGDAIETLDVTHRNKKESEAN